MAKKATYQVRGMHCASCSAVITRKLGKLPGVESCEVNYATERATISHDPQIAPIARLNDEIKKLGYSLVERAHAGQGEHSEHATHGTHNNNQGDARMDHSEHLGLSQTKEEKLQELEQLSKKVNFVLPLTILVFIVMMWDVAAQVSQSVPNFPLPMDLFNPLQFLIATIILFWIGKPFIEGALRFAKYGVANMDSLIGIGTLTAYIYSAFIYLFAPIARHVSLPEFTYFDVTIVVIGFVTLGKYLEVRSKIKTGQAIEKLLNLQAKTALVIREGKEIEVSIQEVVVGDLIVVKPGGKVPVDGVITEGSSAIDESMVTGEPMPQDKHKGDPVIGSTINKQGRFIFRATKVGSQTMLSQIIQMVEEAQGSKAPIQNLADTISGIFVPVVLVLAVLTLLVWLTVGTYFLGFATAFSLGLLAFVGILVIACPCALGLATPTAIIVGVGKGAEHGILIKNAEYLEKLQAVTAIIFDKTGTITQGKPVVSDVRAFNSDLSETDVLQLAASLEHNSNHPLAQAVTDKAAETGVELYTVTDFKEMEGIGVSGTIKNKTISVRRPLDLEKADEQIAQFSKQGKTVVVVDSNKKAVGILAISDTVKPSAKLAIKKLHKLGIETIMVTGDNKYAAEYIAAQVGITRVIAEVLPQDKSQVVHELHKEGKKVAMVGDGINDAPALAAADVGMAMGTGTDVAIETAGITLLRSEIALVPQAIKLSKATLRTIKQNLFWAFAYNVILIPVAMGVLYPLWGITLNPVFAGAAMATSSVSVVLNALRLRTARLE